MREQSLLLLLLILVLISACTDKDNPVGYNSLDEPRYLELDGIIGNYYSYEDTVNSYSNSSILTVGNQEKYEMVSLMRFYNFPDSVADLESEQIALNLVVNKQTGGIDHTIKIGKIKEYWTQNYVTHVAATDTIDWDEPFEEPFFEFSILEELNTSDTILVEIPIEYFFVEENGMFYADSLLANYGFYLKRASMDAASRAFMEFYSYESDESLRPSLSFGYKSDPEDEEFSTWESSTIYDDSFFTSFDNDLEEFTIFPEELKLMNVSPVKMLLEINIGVDNFTSLEDSGIESWDDYDRMTINCAQLKLYVKEHYGVNDYVYVQPAMIIDSTITQIPDQGDIPIYEEEYELISGVTSTQDSLKSDGDYKYFKIDITSELQSIITDKDEYDGYGVVIRSLRENRDFSFIEFYTGADDPLLSPSLEVYYTPPLEP